MRILVVAPSVPHPPDHGQRLRTWHLTKALAARHEVHLLTWQTDESGSADLAACEEAFHRVNARPAEAERPGVAARIRRHASFLLGSTPPYVAELKDERGLDTDDELYRLGRFVQESQPDIVVLEDESVPVFDLPLPAAPTVLHRLNVFPRVVGDIPAKQPLRRLTMPLELAGWRRFERRAGAGADLLVTPTEESAREVAASEPDKRVEVVTNGVVPPAEPLRPDAGSDVAFIGWMGYPPNVDAVEWFTRQIWPIVRGVHRSSRFAIIGRAPSAAVRALASADVVVTGEVPDVVEAARGARVGVVPLRAGMGIKNKTLELMAMGIPVVATSAGAEGIAAGPAEGLTIADDAATFADAVIRLLGDPAAAVAEGARARAFVSENFRWEAIGARYRRLVESVVAG